MQVITIIFLEPATLSGTYEVIQYCFGLFTENGYASPTVGRIGIHTYPLSDDPAFPDGFRCSLFMTCAGILVIIRFCFTSFDRFRKGLCSRKKK